MVLYYSIAITEYDSGIVVSNKQVLGNQSVIEVEFDGLSKFMYDCTVCIEHCSKCW